MWCIRTVDAVYMLLDGWITLLLFACAYEMCVAMRENTLRLVGAELRIERGIAGRIGLIVVAAPDSRLV